MSLVKYQNPKGLFSSFDDLFDTFFNGNISDFVGSDYFLSNPYTNIKETEDNFELELAAPGLRKSDFSLNIEQDTLTIETKKGTEPKAKSTHKFVRREFNYASFKRSFSLPDTVATDKIEAKYEQGVLVVTLPKKDEAKPLPARQITIV